MIKKVVIISLIILLLLGTISCKKKTEETTINIENPFISGTEGIEASFEYLRSDVRDQSQDPFDIILKIENKGETDIPANKIKIKISGINPYEFSVTPQNLIKTSTDTAISQKKTIDGEITPSPPTFIEFIGLNYKAQITGTQITFPIKADICYAYKTEAVGKICIRENILKTNDGICEVSGDKTIYSSSAPIQITNLKESARSKNKIGFTFEIINSRDGSVYEKDTSCDKSKRQNENRVLVKIETNLDGLTCAGLENTGKGKVEGQTTLYAGTKIISCTQTTPVNDFEQVIKITAEYDYEISKRTQIIVKSSDTI